MHDLVKEMIDAAQEGNLSEIKRIIEASGGALNVNSTMSGFFSEGDEEAYDNHYDDESKTTVLHAALDNGQEELALTLLNEMGADPRLRDANGRNALHWAASTESLSSTVMETLTAPSWDVDVNARDSEGKTALIIAVENSCVEKVRFLVQTLNVDLNRVNNNGETALECIATSGNLLVPRLAAKMDIIAKILRRET